MSVVERGL